MTYKLEMGRTLPSAGLLSRMNRTGLGSGRKSLKMQTRAGFKTDYESVNERMISTAFDRLTKPRSERHPHAQMDDAPGL